MTTARRGNNREIDWGEIRQRLSRLAAATATALDLPPDQARALLEERARLLARVPASVLQAAEMVEVATFTLSSESYAIETEHVREVVRLIDYTPVPGTPDFLVGVMNLRGEILAVIDLRKFLGVARGGLTDLARVFVLGGSRAEFGILADAADQVLTLRADEVLEPPESVAGVGREYLRGVTQDALIVLDGAVLLRDARLFIDQAEESGLEMVGGPD